MLCVWMIGAILFAGSLATACVMDIKEQMVYRFLWLIGGTGAGVLVVLRTRGGMMPWSVLMELAIFVLLQQVWFGRFYGRADCHAFSMCAVMMTALGLEFRDYVMQMFFTFLGLTLVQLFRRNVTSGGRLKEPVALIPYITAAFGLWVDFNGGKWYI